MSETDKQGKGGKGSSRKKSGAKAQPATSEKKDAAVEPPPEPAESREPGESREPAESTEPAESREPAESTEPAQSTEPAESREPAESTEPAQSTEPAESTEPADAGAVLITALPPVPAAGGHPARVAQLIPQAPPTVPPAPVAGGHPAPVVGGHAAPVAGGHPAPVVGGHAAPVAGGHPAPVAGGHPASTLAAPKKNTPPVPAGRAPSMAASTVASATQVASSAAAPQAEPSVLTSPAQAPPAAAHQGQAPPASGKGCVSAIIVSRVPDSKRERFLEWQNQITQATTKFAGYERTEMYPPVPGVQDEWVTIVHFRSNEELEAWLASAERAQLSRRYNEEIGDFDLRKVASGLGFWFTSSDVPPWKMVLTVVCGLYPTLCALQLTVMPFLNGQPMVLKLLLGAFMSVSLLQWVVMPPLRKVLGWWHHPTQPSTALDITGAVAILAFLVVCAVLFRLYLG